MTGIAAGMALRGCGRWSRSCSGISSLYCRPADQPHHQVPLDVQRPGARPAGHPHAMGGRRGYGPTHSQTAGKNIPGRAGLRVLAPSAIGDPGGCSPRLSWRMTTGAVL